MSFLKSAPKQNCDDDPDGSGGDDDTDDNGDDNGYDDGFLPPFRI